MSYEGSLGPTGNLTINPDSNDILALASIVNYDFVLVPAYDHTARASRRRDDPPGRYPAPTHGPEVRGRRVVTGLKNSDNAKFIGENPVCLLLLNALELLSFSFQLCFHLEFTPFY